MIYLKGILSNGNVDCVTFLSKQLAFTVSALLFTSNQSGQISARLALMYIIES